MSSRTPSTLAPKHTHAISSLLVTTAVTRAARPMTARTSATISMTQPRSVVSPVELVESAAVVVRGGIHRCRRAALAELFELRFQIRLEPRAVLALEGAQLLEATLEHGPLLVDGAHDLGVLALGVRLQGIGLLLSLAKLRLGARLRIGQQGIGTRLGFRHRGFRGVAGLAHHGI